MQKPRKVCRVRNDNRDLAESKVIATDAGERRWKFRDAEWRKVGVAHSARSGRGWVRGKRTGRIRYGFAGRRLVKEVSQVVGGGCGEGGWGKRSVCGAGRYSWREGAVGMSGRAEDMRHWRSVAAHRGETSNGQQGQQQGGVDDEIHK